jgi:hypothetical protein
MRFVASNPSSPHAAIHQHDVGLVAAGVLDRLDTAGSGDDVDAGAFEAGEDVPVDGVVVGHAR